MAYRLAAIAVAAMAAFGCGGGERAAKADVKGSGLRPSLRARARKVARQPSPENWHRRWRRRQRWSCSSRRPAWKCRSQTRRPSWTRPATSFCRRFSSPRRASRCSSATAKTCSTTCASRTRRHRNRCSTWRRLPFGKYEHKFEPGYYNVTCDIHTTMRASILVTASPYTATTAADGSFNLSNVIPGQYNLTIYAGAAPVVRPVEVKSGRTDLGEIR